MYDINNGYKGFSMSNRAVEAYDNGEKPLSKWTKKEIIEKLTNEYSVYFSINVLKRAPVKVVKDLVLVKTSWHHTSNWYNETDFYSIDEEQLSELTNEKIIHAINDYEKKKENKKTNKKYKGKIEYLEWSGTRKHPKATKKIIEDIYIEERGCFFIVTDENNVEIIRKKIGSNGTYVTKNQ